MFNLHFKVKINLFTLVKGRKVQMLSEILPICYYSFDVFECDVTIAITLNT